MVGDKYILEPEAILDHCVAAVSKYSLVSKYLNIMEGIR